MKKFVVNFFVFGFCLIGVFFIIDFTVGIYSLKKTNFIIEKQNKYIVLGHSHSGCSINDKLVDSLVNLSSSGESYFYSYYKLRKMIEYNPNIETVLLEFSNNNISEQMDDWLFGRNMKSNYLKYSHIVDYYGKYFLFKEKPNLFLRSFINNVLTKTNDLINMNKNYNNLLGGHIEVNKNITDSLLNNNLYLKRNYEFNFNNKSNYSIKYIKKIIDYCDEKEINLILMRSPLHENYKGLENEDMFLLEQKQLSNDKVSFLDFSKFPFENIEFVDYQHLNEKGANKFSNWLSSFIKSGGLKLGNESLKMEISKIKI